MADSFQRYKQIRSAIFFLRSIHATVSVNGVNAQFKTALKDRGVRRDVIARCIHIEREEQYRRDRNLLRGELTLEAFDAIREHLGTIGERLRTNENDSERDGNHLRTNENEGESLNSKRKPKYKSNVTSSVAVATPDERSADAPTLPGIESTNDEAGGEEAGNPAAEATGGKPEPKPRKRRSSTPASAAETAEQAVVNREWESELLPGDIQHEWPKSQDESARIVTRFIAIFGNVTTPEKVAKYTPAFSDTLAQMQNRRGSTVFDAWRAFQSSRRVRNGVPLFLSQAKTAMSYLQVSNVTPISAYSKPNQATRKPVEYFTAESIARLA